jgi:hypothetical protein
VFSSEINCHFSGIVVQVEFGSNRAQEKRFPAFLLGIGKKYRVCDLERIEKVFFD